MAKLPRGYRNNNPGNIRKGQKWQGLADLQPDADFCTFTSPVFGLRALMKTLLTYKGKYFLDTVELIISRWAPPNENDTRAYIRAVAKALAVEPTAKLKFDSSTLIKLSRAIVAHELGSVPTGLPAGWYSDEMYQKAAEMALA